MTDKEKRRQIEALIRHGECADVEFKTARGGLPGTLWESYSALANTNGGTIVLGVKETEKGLELDGMSEAKAAQYKKNFRDLAHNSGKVSVCLPREDDVYVEEIDGSYILICEIPRASYEQRPVYLNNTPFGNTYRRNHEGDYRCTDTEVRRMFADADINRHPQDGIILEGYKFGRDIDLETLRQYRQTFASLQPTHPWVGLDDMDFMRKIGAYTTDYATGKQGFTIAGILMFGKYDSITNSSGLPYYFVDYRERIATDDPNIRWTHRIYPDGMWEANLYQFYVRTYNRLIQAIPRPFMIRNGIRQEETPAHYAVREALINCLVHQDINARSNIIVERTDNALTFSNPGTMLVSMKQYFAGGTSICRNPILQKMFMLLGRAEKAGSGVDKIVNGWRTLHWPAPSLTEKSRPDYVVLTLQIGKVTDRKNHTGNTVQDDHTGNTVQDDHTGNTVQDNHTRKTVQDNRTRRFNKTIEKRRMIMDFCREPRTITAILHHVGLKNRGYLMANYINPLIANGELEMTQPDKPTSKNQSYKTKR